MVRRLPQRSQDGVKLSSAQYLRFVQLQRFETVDPQTGLTFREALEECEQLEIKSPPKKTWVSAQ